LFALALTLIALSVLVLAVVLKPSPQGRGTHPADAVPRRPWRGFGAALRFLV